MGLHGQLSQGISCWNIFLSRKKIKLYLIPLVMDYNVTFHFVQFIVDVMYVYHETLTDVESSKLTLNLLIFLMELFKFHFLKRCIF